MTDESRIVEALAQAEAELDRGCEPDLASLCEPHLLPEARRRFDALRTMRDVMDPAPKPRPAPRVQLPDGYQVVRELGGGNMGVVYLARDRKGRSVAVKTLLRLDAARLEYLKREFQSLVGLRHENVVEVYEQHSDGNNWYCVMEHVDGRHLLEHVRSVDCDSHAETATLHISEGRGLRSAFAQLAAGLHFLHGASRLHRDIKSSNVMVSPDGRVKLIDFGLIAELNSQQAYEQSGLVGTVGYMSPEQCGNRPLGPASDWYSFGVLLFEALTGRPPFTGTIIEIINRKQVETPPRACNLVPGLPADLDELCAELLRIDPAKRPSGAEILRRLGVEAAKPEVEDDSAWMLGRDRHRSELLDAAATVRRTRVPLIVQVHGPSGAGKTALIERFLQDLRESGAAVILTGRCFEQSSVPYKALDGLIDSLCRHLRRKSREQIAAVLPVHVADLARLFPVLGRLEAVAESPPPGNPDDPYEVRRRAFRALRDLLDRLGSRTPLMLVVDDLQWGDAESASLLAELLRPPDAPPLLFLASYRRGDAAASPFLKALGVLDCAKRELAVDPLSEAEARELAAKLIDRDDSLAAVIAHESAGNPLLIHELVRFFRTHDSASPPTIGTVIRSRVNGLREHPRRLLEAVSISAGPLDVESAFQAAEIPLHLQGGALDTLLSGKFALTVGSGEKRSLETYHDRIRETVASDLAPDARAALHHRLAIVRKAADNAEPEVLAYHFSEGGDAVQASHFFALAAEQSVAALAFDRAADQYQAALERCPPNAARRRALLLSRAGALATAARGLESATAFADAAELSVGTDALFCRWRAAEQLMRCGRISEGMEVLNTVLKNVGIDLPATDGAIRRSLRLLRLRLWLRGLAFRPRSPETLSPEVRIRIEVCRWAAGLLRMSDMILSGWFHSLGLLLSLRTGDALGAAFALGREAIYPPPFRLQTPERIERILSHAQSVADGITKPEEREFAIAILRLQRLVGHSGYLDLRRALADSPAVDEALRKCSEPSVAYQRLTLRIFDARNLLLLGELKSFRELLDASSRGLRERGNLHGAVTFPLIAQAHLLALANDDPETARRRIHDAIGLWSQNARSLQHFCAWVAELDILLYEDRAEEAYKHVHRTHENALRPNRRSDGMVWMLHEWANARAAVARAASGAPERNRLLRGALRNAREMERLLVPRSGPAHGWMIRAAAAHLQGDDSAARAWLDRAGKEFETLGMIPHAAAVRYRSGQLLGAAGAELIATAERDLREREVRNPARFIRVYAPGF